MHCGTLLVLVACVQSGEPPAESLPLGPGFRDDVQDATRAAEVRPHRAASAVNVKVTTDAHRARDHLASTESFRDADFERWASKDSMSRVQRRIEAALLAVETAYHTGDTTQFKEESLPIGILALAGLGFFSAAWFCLQRMCFREGACCGLRSCPGGRPLLRALGFDTFDDFPALVVLHSVEPTRVPAEGQQYVFYALNRGWGCGDAAPNSRLLRRAEDSAAAAGGTAKGAAGQKLTLPIQQGFPEIQVALFEISGGADLALRGLAPKETYLGCVTLQVHDELIAANKPLQQEPFVVINAKGRHVAKVVLTIYVPNYRQLAVAGFPQDHLTGLGYSLAFAQCIEDAYRRLARYNALHAGGRPREVSRATVLGMLLTGNLLKFSPDNKSRLHFFEVQWKKSARGMFWVWYESPAGSEPDAAMPGVMPKSQVLGFVPVKAVLSIQAIKEPAVGLMITYRAPKRTRAQLVLAPDPSESDFRGRDELIAALLLMMKCVDDGASDDSDEEWRHADRDRGGPSLQRSTTSLQDPMSPEDRGAASA